eukprot:3352262-Rhodomonas_salina.1
MQPQTPTENLVSNSRPGVAPGLHVRGSRGSRGSRDLGSQRGNTCEGADSRADQPTRHSTSRQYQTARSRYSVSVPRHDACVRRRVGDRLRAADKASGQGL